MNRLQLKVFVVEPSHEMSIAVFIVVECPSTDHQINTVTALQLQRRMKRSRVVIAISKGASQEGSIQS